MSSDHLQLGEVLERLNHDAACSIVDPEAEHACEVAVRFDESGQWTVQARVRDEPRSELAGHLLVEHFKVIRVEDRLLFGPDRGKEFVYYRIFQAFDEIEAAARAGLALFAMLWNPPSGKWLWITAENYADRGELEPPAVWPPPCNTV